MEYKRRKESIEYALKYSYFHPAHLFHIQTRQRAILDLLKREGINELKDKMILDVGCGDGNVLRELQRFGANPKYLHGVELLAWRCKEYKAKSPECSIMNSDGRNLPYSSNTFDLALQYTMFTSILEDEIRRMVAEELCRILKPDGYVIWYDFWLNPTNPHTKGIRLNEIKRLFPGCQIRSKRITLAPPIARRLAPISWLACEILESLKIFNTHYLALINPVK